MNNYFARVSLFALLAGALMLLGAGGAYAEAEVYGDVSASLANVDIENDAPGVADKTEYIGGMEANMWWKGGMDNMTAKFRLRVRGARERDTGTTDAVSALRGHVQWKASDLVLLTFHGRSLGALGAKEYAKVYNVRNEVGNNDVDNEIGIRNATGISLHLNLDKAINLGFYIMDECKPECFRGASSDPREDDVDTDPGPPVVITETPVGVEEDSTMVVEAFGKTGPIRYGIYIGSAEATSVGTAKSVESDMMQAGVQYKQKGFSIGLDIGNSELDLNDTVGDSDTQEFTTTHIGARIGPFGVSYFQSEEERGGASEEDITELDVTYKFKVTKLGHLSVELRIVETEDTSGTPTETVTETALVFGAKTKF